MENTIGYIKTFADEGSFKQAPCKVGDGIAQWQFTVNGGRVTCQSSVDFAGLYAFRIEDDDIGLVLGKGEA